MAGKRRRKNETEIEGLIELAKKGMVDVAAVGNEVLYRNDLTLEQLLEYIKRVKAEIPDIPVGYVDAYYEFSVHPELAETCDVVLCNCYPYWEGTSFQDSLNHMRKCFIKPKLLRMVSELSLPKRDGLAREKDLVVRFHQKKMP